MLIISVEIMKIIDEGESNNNNNKKRDRKEQGGTEAIMKGSELNDFVVHLN